MIFLLAQFFRRASRVIPFALCVALFASSFPGQLAAAEAAQGISASAHRPGEIIVQFQNDSAPILVQFSPETDVEKVSEDIASRPDVSYAEPNYVYTLAAFDPNDPFYSEQWYMRQIQMPLAWEISAGSSSVTVAVLDSGVDVNHPDLRDNIWTNPGEVPNDGRDNDGNGFTDDVHGWDFIEWSNDPRPSATPPYSRTALHHGTIVAGIIGATGNNLQGVAGVSWRSRVMPLRVLDRQGQGDVEQVAQAVDYAVKNGADVVNLSFVGQGYSQRLYDALRRAYSAGVLIVVAAGNTSEHGGSGDLDQSFLYPICYDAADVSGENWILGVTATDTLDQRASFANIGSRCVDIAAPGSNFVSTQVFDPTLGLNEPYGGQWAGTSLAAPLVSGAAALLIAQGTSNTPTELVRTLTQSADDISKLNGKIAAKLGKGRLNVARALRGEIGGVNGNGSTGTAFGQVVVSPNGFRSIDYKVTDAAGKVARSLTIPTREFAAGGSVAVSENARTSQRDNQVRLSTIVRGDQLLAFGEGALGRGRVRLYDVSGTLLHEWFAYGERHRGGVEVASGDISGTGEGSIVTVPMSGGPLVRIFDREGKVRGQFFAYDASVRGGFDVAVADVNADGQEDIIVSSTSGYQQVRVFDGRGTLLTAWDAFSRIPVGVRVSAGDMDGDRRAEVVVAPVNGRDVRILTGYGNLIGQFPVYPVGFRGGVQVDVGDVDSDGLDDIVTAPASRGGAQVRIFDRRARVIGQFFVYDQRLRGGLSLAVLR